MDRGLFMAWNNAAAALSEVIYTYAFIFRLEKCEF